MDKKIQSNILEFVSQNPAWVIVIYGPTGCGKTGLSIEVAQFLRTIAQSEIPTLQTEIVSVDARQVYRGLDIGTGKITREEMQWIPHHMLDIIDVTEVFSVVEYKKRVEELEIWKKMREQLFYQKDKNLSGLWGDTFATKSMGNGIWNKDTRSQVWELEDDRNTGLFQPRGWREQSESQKYFPILCGGTWLYIDSLIYERDYMGEKPDTTRRDELEQYRREHGNQALWNILHEIDPVYAAMLHVNNYTYIIRGIEVFEKTGKSKLEAQHGQKLLYPTLFLTPYADSTESRTLLYTRINERIEKMFSSWLVEETRYIIDNLSRELLQNSNNTHCPWLATIGYAEVVEYIEWNISLDECISLVQQHNRNYAKRQITWNKKYGTF